MRGFLLAAAGLIALLHQAEIAGAAAPVSVDQYRARIHHVRLILDNLAQDHTTRTAELRAAAGELKSGANVRLSNRRIIVTPATEWANALESATPPSTADVVVQVDALDHALGAAQRSSIAAANMRELDAILSEPRFHHSQSLQDRLLQWLSGLVARFLDALAGSYGAASILVKGGLGVLLLGLVAGLAYLLARRALGRMVVEVTAADTAHEPVTSRAATDRASERAAEGDYRTAYRYLFLATLLRLQERKLLRLHPGMTNREFLRTLQIDLPRGEAAAEALTELIDEFDRVWYGHLPFDANAYARCEVLVRRVMELTESEQAA